MCDDDCWLCDTFSEGEPSQGDINQDRLEQEDFGVYMEDR